MEQEINRFTAYTNCPSGEYWAIFSNSEVKKYPNKGFREVLTFLILNDDKQTPKLNNKEEKDVKKEAAKAISKTRKAVDSDLPNKKIWTTREIGNLKPDQFEKFEKEIDLARLEGRIEQ